MGDIAVIVEFDAVAGKGDELFAVLSAHGVGTLREEPGCLRFEVIRPMDAEGLPVRDAVAVSELYRGQDALDAHQASPRRPALADALARLTVSRRVLKGRVTEGGLPNNELERGQP